MTNKILNREGYESFQDLNLSDYGSRATDPKLTKREHLQEPDEYRSEYSRDYTRIIHSRAFRRMSGKTQVFIQPKNDHLSTRLDHCILVSSIAQTISRALKLNEDLTRAIAIGHDLGHSPFGHEGEAVLRKILEEKGCDLTFHHETHGLRVIDHLDSPYLKHTGLNLTFAVRDGIACHCGEEFDPLLTPVLGKEPTELINMKPRKTIPATFEGCVVRFADKIAYIGKDLEDALTLGIVNAHQVPSNVKKKLGIKNREIVDKLIKDILENGISADSIMYSAGIHEALGELVEFNYDFIYKSDQARRYYQQVEKAIRLLFDYFLELLPDCMDEDIDIYEKYTKTGVSCATILCDFLQNDVRDHNDVPKEQLVVDFIAGMTDKYFIECFNEIFFPKSVV